MRRKNKIIILLFTLFFFFPLSSFAAIIPFGQPCATGDSCTNGFCEQSTLSVPQNKFCVCSSDSQCETQFGKKTTQETWTCKPGEDKTKNLHYCLSTTRGTQDPIATGAEPAAETPAPPASGTSEEKIKLTPPLVSIPIPGLAAFDELEVSPGDTVNVPYIAQYIIAIYKYGLVIGALLAVMMIMIGGIIYLTAAGAPGLIGTGKTLIYGAVSGMVLLLGSYLLLLTINPNLVNLAPISIETVKKDIQYLGPEAYEAVTGTTLLPTGEYQIMAVAAGRTVGFTDDCIMVSLLKQESGGRPDAIGHDENVHWNIPSRRAFLKSGIKWSGVGTGTVSFTPIATIDTKSSDQKSIKNDDPTKDIEHLDWRFSHGLGLTQITIFPTEKCNGGVGKKNPFTGVCYTPAQLLQAQNSLDYGAALLKSLYVQAGKKGMTGEDQILGAFLGYNAGPGNMKKESLATHHYPVSVKKLLDACHAQNP